MNQKSTPIEKPITSDDIEQLEVIEMLFFAYRDFIADADRLLADYDFGRAHHRALFFVNRSPGMNVAELLEILRIKKQSLGRVLKQLIETGHIIQTEGQNDRRKRLLYPTQKGRDLIMHLSLPQSKRLKRAQEPIDQENRDDLLEFLRRMIG